MKPGRKTSNSRSSRQSRSSSSYQGAGKLEEGDFGFCQRKRHRTEKIGANSEDEKLLVRTWDADKRLFVNHNPEIGSTLKDSYLARWNRLLKMAVTIMART